MFAWVIGNTPVLRPEFQNAVKELAIHASDLTFGTAILRGIFAGWLIALVVRMIAGSRGPHACCCRLG